MKLRTSNLYAHNFVDSPNADAKFLDKRKRKQVVYEYYSVFPQICLLIQCQLTGRPPNAWPIPFKSVTYGAESGLVPTGLGAYGDHFLGSGSELMQSNVYFHLSRHFFYR